MCNTLCRPRPWLSRQVKAAFINFKDVSSYAFSTSSKIDYLTELFFKKSHTFNNNPSNSLNLLHFGIKWQKEAMF